MASHNDPLFSKESSSNSASSTDNVRILKPDHVDPLSLWNSFRKGDEQAFVSIFDSYTKVLYNYGYKISGNHDRVKDAIQELFIEIWRNKEKLGETTSIKYYLFKSLRRKLIRTPSKLEKTLMVRWSLGIKEPSVPCHEFILIAEQSSAELKQKVQTLLDGLTKRQREAIYLRYFEELSYDKIASIMDLSRQAIYNLISKGISELKNTVTNHTD
ncbi:MAG: sigma-70 family RNA polymerase sigma factor [Chryseolinea sp.]